ncbi:type II secretion system protein [Mastigocladus laminosus UU774]|nr:type II secretion system protein [Mastigocladus laminosus UU774]
MIHYKLRHTSPSNESGFTIIESLVAILVVAILLAAIAPVFVISVATRVQAKRIETATDAAKTYIDGVRSGVITSLPPVTSTPPSPCDSDIDLIKAAIACTPPPPTGTLTCSSSSTPGSTSDCSSPSATNSKLYCMNLDGNGCSSSSTNNTNNLIIQAFGYNTASTDPTKGYILGVRVYRVDGFASAGGDLKKAPSKQATFTGGLGDRKAPLLEVTTEISNDETKFSDLCDRLQDTNNTASDCKP